MSYRSLDSYAPALTFIGLPLEQRADILFAHIESCEGTGSTTYQSGGIHLNNLMTGGDGRSYVRSVEFAKQQAVDHAIREAWHELVRTGFLIPRDNNGWHFIPEGKRNRRGPGAPSRIGPLPFLVDARLTKAAALFEQGHYDDAVKEAFQFVEIAVRDEIGARNDVITVTLMREAFKVGSKDPSRSDANGPLTDPTAPEGEQHGLRDLFSGAMGVIRNPVSHRRLQLTPAESMERLALANLLLRFLDAAVAQARTRTT
jgi:uncharacterized protein (TIGR02391 family)